MSVHIFGPKKWDAGSWTGADKEVLIVGPETLTLTVDHDDVDLDAVDEAIPLIVERLNAPPPFPPDAAALAALRAENGRLREALVGVEWVGWSGRHDQACCVECGAPKCSGHMGGCVVGRVLATTKPGETK